MEDGKPEPPLALPPSIPDINAAIWTEVSFCVAFSDADEVSDGVVVGVVEVDVAVDMAVVVAVAVPVVVNAVVGDEFVAVDVADVRMG